MSNRQSAAETFSLHVVPLEKVIPHETCDVSRVTALTARLRTDGYLANPPVVAAWGEQYVVLDGATRLTALRQLHFPHIIVQVVEPERNGTQLHTWCHAIHGGSVAEFLALLGTVDGLRMVEMDPERLPAAISAQGALAYLLTADGRGFLLTVDAGAAGTAGDWLDVLNRLVAGYMGWGTVARTLFTDVDSLIAQYSGLAGVVVFPRLTFSTVLQLAGQGRTMPAGITRFVIPGRVLRLNAPLAELERDDPIHVKRDWLDRLIQAKLAGRQVRYYQEPVILLDE